MNPQKIQALIKAAYLEAADWADDVRLDHAFLDDAEAVVTAFYEAFREEITWRDLAEHLGPAHLLRCRPRAAPHGLR